jgi:hypothetical protein
VKEPLFLLDRPFGLFYTLPGPKEILVRFFRHIESYSYLDLKWEILMEGIRLPHFSGKKWGFLLALKEQFLLVGEASGAAYVFQVYRCKICG